MPGCFFFKQKTAYEVRISDWSSDVCSSDLIALRSRQRGAGAFHRTFVLKPLCLAALQQLQRAGADLHGVCCSIMLCMEAGKIGISSGNAGREGEPRGCRFSPCRLSLGPGCGKRCAVFAPEVQIPVEAKCALTVVGPSPRREVSRDKVIVDFIGGAALGARSKRGQKDRKSVV